MAALLAAMMIPSILYAVEQSQGIKSPQVVQFIRNAEACEHLAGEWDPDMSMKEKRVIERNIDKYCGLAQRQRARLLPMFKNDVGVLQSLNQYEAAMDYAPVK